MPPLRALFPASSLPVYLAAMLCAAPAVPAEAEVHRCTTPTGESVFTDKRCEDIGAIDRLPRTQAGGAGAARLYRSSCSRTLQDLVYQLTSAIDSHDVNRLAGVYDWAGMSSQRADTILDRLDAIAQKPLVDVTPVVPAVADPDGSLVDGEYYPQAATPRVPVGLRLEQTVGKSATPSRTVFGLRRYMGCWWVKL